MMNFGWKHKAERLRMVILSAGHQQARELPPSFTKILAIFRRVDETKDGMTLQDEIDRAIAEASAETPPLWEPIEIYGWKIQATFYLLNKQLWWLAHAVRKDERAPREKDIVFLDKVLTHLDADPIRDCVIGPRSSPPGAEPLPFGWYTWFNRQALFEVQLHATSRNKKDVMRVVPLGTPPSDGYTSVDMSDPRRPRE